MSVGGDCGFVQVPSQRCGFHCGADLSFESGVGDVAACLQQCARWPRCAGLNYVAPGYSDSGGPGRVSRSSGTCYYRTATNCGVSCESGRECFVRRADQIAIGALCSVAANDPPCTSHTPGFLTGAGAVVLIGLVVLVVVILLLVCGCSKLPCLRRRESSDVVQGVAVPATAQAALGEVVTGVPVMRAAAAGTHHTAIELSHHTTIDPAL
jgi:hypothetical protein